jgi:hypothetical protein
MPNRLSIKLISGTKLVLFFLLLSACDSLNAQTVYALEGRLFSQQDSSFVQASNVYTLPSMKGNMSDPNGYFYMEITKMDTLYVKTIGYKTYKIICADLIEHKDFRIHIFLEPKVYQLETVNILGSMTYEEFKDELMELPLAEEQRVDFDIPWEWYYNMNMPASGGFGVTFSGIFSNLYDKHGKEGKQRRKIQNVEADIGRQDYIFSKFNPYIIQRATGLTDEDDIIMFMEYCDFSDYFIVNSTESEIMSALSKKYKIYTALNPKENPKENPKD